MISKAKVKWIKSLQLKKYRQEEQCFVVEGIKGVQELLKSDYEIDLIASTKESLSELSVPKTVKEGKLFEVSQRELESMSSLQSNDSALAVARMKQTMSFPEPTDNYIIALDDIRDPGNLGTIIRTADWFGVNDIVASNTTADFYNPKTISATMGSFCRVNFFYTDLVSYLSSTNKKIYGAFLDGTDIHKLKFEGSGIVVIGNESNGVSPEVEALIKERVFIPGAGRAESLNAAIATAIILDNIFRSK